MFRVFGFGFWVLGFPPSLRYGGQAGFWFVWLCLAIFVLLLAFYTLLFGFQVSGFRFVGLC
ncbi:MAG: hypothetical protein B6D64_01995 [Bacteroidetes bacterium 4484_276]|nr:MAG: hypothetical protein B6D64_01995 [Bacteroidetes bacterium 4484_276]